MGHILVYLWEHHKVQKRSVTHSSYDGEQELNMYLSLMG